MRCVIIIPVRYESSRFPGKPLADILGKSLVHRVYSIAHSLNWPKDVFIATDSEIIISHCKEHNLKFIKTSNKPINGSERVFEAVQHLNYKPELVINLQGDEPLLPKNVISMVYENLIDNPSIEISTPAVKLNSKEIERIKEESGKNIIGSTMVTFSNSNRALYFSKSVIPFLRNSSNNNTVYKHLGIYGYRFESLQKYCELSPSSLELTEGLEQLRALENDILINIVKVSLQGKQIWSVDNPFDIDVVSEIIKKGLD